MKTMTVGELKSHFSEVLKEVQAGDSIGICFGKKREKRAVIIPFEEYTRTHSRRKLGILEGLANYSLAADFEISDKELLGL